MKIIYLLVFLSGVFAGCVDREENKASGKIAAGGYGVYYEISGQGRPLLLIHAGLQNHEMWAEQVKELSKDYRVITIDLPFHGNTTGHDTAMLAKDVVRVVLDSLKIEKTSIAGLSMGAAVTQDFIIHYPERVHKAILISAGLYGYEETHPVDSVSSAWYPQFTAALEKKDTSGAALVFAKAWGEGIDSKGDSLSKPSSRYVYETTLNTLKRHRMQGWPNLQDAPKAFAGITTVRMPLLIIHGDHDLPFVTQTSMYMEKHIPNARRVLLRGAAHMLNMEQPEEVNRLFRDFLKD